MYASIPYLSRVHDDILLYPHMSDFCIDMSKKGQKMSVFVWNETKLKAAEGIARDENKDGLCARLGFARRTLTRWQQHPDFQLKISGIILEIDITQKSERIKIAKAVIEKKLKDAEDAESDPSSKDLLEWMKYVGSEVGDYTPSLDITNRHTLGIASDDETQALANQLLKRIAETNREK